MDRGPTWSRRAFGAAALSSLGLACAHLSARRGRAGAIAAGSPEAARVGLEILSEGGNAIDAAVATAFTLAVTEPAGSGLGGITLMTVCIPNRGVACIDAPAPAPRAMPPQVTKPSVVGHRALVLPTTVGVLGGAWARYGKMPWRKLLQPAIAYAERGFELGPFRIASQSIAEADLQRTPATRAMLAKAPTHRMPPQPALARTLERLGRAGADDFYRGEIGDVLVRDVASHGGWLGASDLRAFRLRERPAVSWRYRDAEVYSHPLPGSGWSVLQMLAMLERAPRAELALEHPRRPWWMTQVMRRGHHRRVLVGAGDSSDATRVERELSAELLDRLYAPIGASQGGETTHLSIMDAHGGAVSLTSSLNTFYGARVASPELGFVYNDYLSKMVPRTGRDHALVLRPGRQPPSSMSPTLVLRDGRVMLALGSPGSERIISAIVQVLTAVLDGKASLARAVSSPRVHFDTLRWHTYAETSRYRQAIRATGLKVSEPEKFLHGPDLDPYFGGIHAVGLEHDLFHAAADPRRDGVGLVVKG